MKAVFAEVLDRAGLGRWGRLERVEIAPGRGRLYATLWGEGMVARLTITPLVAHVVVERRRAPPIPYPLSLFFTRA